jgi:hypothetical protein
MVIAVLIVLAMVMLGLSLPGMFRWAGRDEPVDRFATVPVRLPEPPPVRPDSDNERAEALLARMLMSGALRAGDYQRSMALLAAHDSVRHRPVVPPGRAS